MLENKDIYKNYRKLKNILESFSFILAFFLASIFANLLYKNEGKILSLNSLIFIIIGISIEIFLRILITKYIKYLANRNQNK